MKLGIIADIHNNLIALDCALEYFEKSGCEKVICCGDIVSIGPFPEETVNRVMEINNLICVRGNHEDYLRKIGRGERLTDYMGDNEARYHEWEFERLSKKSKAFLDDLPITRLENIDDISVYMTHYPMNGTEYLNAERNLTLTMCEKMFSGVAADIILFGHSHKYFEYANQQTRFINVPSLGCPSKSKNIAQAGILDIENGQLTYNKVAIEYDVGTVIGEIEMLDYPASEDIKHIFYGL